jgi:hypothetical protein
VADTLESIELEIKHSAAGADSEISKVTKSLSALGRAITTVLPKLGKLAVALDEVAGKNTPITFNDNHTTQIADTINNVKQAATKAQKATVDAASGVDSFKKSLKDSLGPISGFLSSLKRIAMYRFLRTIIKNITQGFSEGLKNAYHFSQALNGSLAQAMDSLSTKSLTMKNQMGAAFGALLQAIMPIILQIIALITRLMQALSALFAAIGGGQYLIAKDVAKGWDEAAGGAKEYKKTLLGFDEINRLDDNSGGGGGGGSNFLDMFDEAELPKWAQWIKDHLDEIKKAAEAVGLAIAAWKLGSLISDLLGLSTSMSTLLGIAMAVAGAFLLVDGALDAFKNGTSWKNVNEMLIGTAALAGGLAIAFGTVGAAIGLIVGGLTLITTALSDFIKKGYLTSESLYALEGGLLALGAGLALLTGSWIPLAVAALVGLVIAIGANAEEINEAVDGFFSDLIPKIDNFLKEIERNTGLDLTALRRTVMFALNYIRFDIEAVVTRLGWIVEDLGRIVKSVSENDWNGAWTAMQQLTHDASVDMSGEVKSMAESVTEDMMNGKASTDDLSQSFTDMLNGVRSNVPSARSEFDSFSTSVQNDVNNTLTPLQKFWDKLTGILSTLQQISGISVSGGLIGLLSGQGWNFSVRESLGLGTRASGGFVDEGEMFVARESGPEMVGSIGGRTAVANNDQIVEGIANGVYDAVSAAMGNQSERPVSVRVYLDSREIRVGQNRLVRAMGV